MAAFCACVHFSPVLCVKIDKCDLQDALRDRVKPEQLDTWLCIAYHESRLKTEAIGELDYGSKDLGLFQIKDKYWCEWGKRGKGCNMDCNSEYVNLVTKPSNILIAQNSLTTTSLTTSGVSRGSTESTRGTTTETDSRPGNERIQYLLQVYVLTPCQWTGPCTMPTATSPICPSIVATNGKSHPGRDLSFQLRASFRGRQRTEHSFI